MTTIHEAAADAGAGHGSLRVHADVSLRFEGLPDQAAKLAEDLRRRGFGITWTVGGDELLAFVATAQRTAELDPATVLDALPWVVDGRISDRP